MFSIPRKHLNIYLSLPLVGGKTGETTVDGVKITHFKHATIMIEYEGKVICIDPFELPSGAKKADIILFTHGHYDHCADPSAIMKENTQTIGAGCKFAKQNMGEGEKITVGDITIETVPAYNIGKRFHPKGQGVGFIITIGGKRIYQAGDTDFIPEMKNIKADVAILPIGGTYTMNIDGAIEAAKAIKPKIAIPIHYGAIEGTEADPSKFKEALEKEGIKVEII